MWGGLNRKILYRNSKGSEKHSYPITTESVRKTTKRKKVDKVTLGNQRSKDSEKENGSRERGERTRTERGVKIVCRKKRRRKQGSTEKLGDPEKKGGKKITEYGKQNTGGGYGNRGCTEEEFTRDRIKSRTVFFRKRKAGRSKPATLRGIHPQGRLKIGCAKSRGGGVKDATVKLNDKTNQLQRSNEGKKRGSHWKNWGAG